MDEWVSSAEQIAISQIIKGTRLLGFVSPNGASSTAGLTRMVAEAMGRSGLKILMANLNTAHEEVVRQNTAVATSEPWGSIKGETNDFIDIISANVTDQTRYIFNNNEWLGSFFAETLRSYSTVVLNLPPFIGDQKNQLSPLAAASVCEAVVLICPAGRVTRPQIANALYLLKSANVKVIGLVVEEDEQQSSWRDVAWPAKWTRFPAPAKRA